MTRFESYEALCRAQIPNASAWRILLGALIVIALWVTGSVILLVGLELLGIRVLSPNGFALGEPMPIVLFLLSFGVVHLALVLVVLLFHRGQIGWILSLRTPWPTRHVPVGAAVVGVIFAAALALTWGIMPPEAQLAPSTWIIWVVPTLLALVIQCSAEEAFFRGYLQGLLAARFGTYWVWLVLPAALFGAAHYNAGSYPGNDGLIALSAALMGLVVGDVTARTGSILAAIGVHLGNNAIGVLLVATPGPLDGLALARADIDPSDTETMRLAILLNIAMIVAGYIGWRIWIARQPGLPTDDDVFK
ncbi:MAG: type II CAAX endopeptidase family protein [Pseudomonadota bacterium]